MPIFTEQGHAVSLASIHSWEDSQRRTAVREHGPGLGRARGHETGSRLEREELRARVDVLGVVSARSLLLESNDRSTFQSRGVSEGFARIPEAEQNPAGPGVGPVTRTPTQSGSAVPPLRDYVEQEAAQLIDLAARVHIPHWASEAGEGMHCVDTNEPRDLSYLESVPGVQNPSCAGFERTEDTTELPAAHCTPAFGSVSTDQDESILVEAVDRPSHLSIPRCILEQTCPPLVYGDLVINMQHPAGSNVEWSLGWQDQERARRAIFNQERLPSPIFWSLPGINGLPMSPLEYKVS